MVGSYIASYTSLTCQIFTTIMNRYSELDNVRYMYVYVLLLLLTKGFPPKTVDFSSRIYESSVLLCLFLYWR